MKRAHRRDRRGPFRRGAAAPARQRGAALLLAMLIVTLVATMAAGMAWQQTRAVRIEAAERAATQAGWILDGALDWARLILREDARAGGSDHLGEPWATPLAEARLSSFLAVDQQNNADTGPEAFISGAIADAQAKYNLRNLVDAEGKPVEVELKALQRLCAAVGVPSDTAARIAGGLEAAWGPAQAGEDAPLRPTRIDDLVWLGLDAATVARLRPYLTLLPAPTAVNANTAPREVLVAAIDGLDLGSAERLVQARQRQPFDGLEAVGALLPESIKLEQNQSRIGVRSTYFEVAGRLRVDDRVVEESSLVERRGADRGMSVVTLQRRRQQLRLGPT